jgi:hypothetical protein
VDPIVPVTLAITDDNEELIEWAEEEGISYIFGE